MIDPKKHPRAYALEVRRQRAEKEAADLVHQNLEQLRRAYAIVVNDNHRLEDIVNMLSDNIKRDVLNMIEDRMSYDITKGIKKVIEEETIKELSKRGDHSEYLKIAIKSSDIAFNVPNSLEAKVLDHWRNHCAEYMKVSFNFDPNRVGTDIASSKTMIMRITIPQLSTSHAFWPGI